jgi:hypothetical protein
MNGNREMQIESACPQCGNLLKVRSEYLGNRLRCPKCNFVFLAREIPVVELEAVPEAEPEDVPVLPLDEPEEVVLTVAPEEVEELPVVTVAAGPEPPRKAPPLPKQVELVLDGPPQPQPPFVVVHQPLRWRSHRVFRLYLQPEELRAIFVGVPPGEREANDPKVRKRREDRLKAIEVTAYADLLKDHRLNFPIELDDVTQATLGSCGGWYRYKYRPPRETRLLTLWHRKLGKLRLEVRTPQEVQKLADFLPGSLGKRLKTS